MSAEVIEVIQESQLAVHEARRYLQQLTAVAGQEGIVDIVDSVRSRQLAALILSRLEVRQTDEMSSAHCASLATRCVKDTTYASRLATPPRHIIATHVSSRLMTSHHRYPRLITSHDVTSSLPTSHHVSLRHIIATHVSSLVSDKSPSPPHHLTLITFPRVSRRSFTG